MQEEIIAQISFTEGLATKWINRHKRELTFNQKLIEDWGEQSTQGLPDGVWTSDHLVLRNGGQIYSKGSGGQIRGDHPTELIVDDLEDRKRARNPELREKDKEYFYADLYGALEPHSRIKVVGTIVHPLALLKELYDKEIVPPRGLENEPQYSESWVKFKFSALLPDGSPLAPEIWPLPALLWRKAQLPPGIWKAEYMNEPEVSENPVFPSSWFNKDFNHYDCKAPEFVQNLQPKLKIISFMDAAAKEKETNDYSSIVTVGYRLAEQTPAIYVLGCQRFRKSWRQTVQEAVNTWLKWRGRIGFEGISFQSWLGEEFNERCREMQVSPDWYTTEYRDREPDGSPAPKERDKVTRALKVQYFFELNYIKFDYRDPGQAILIDDLKIFPDGEHDDTVDALVGALWECDRLFQASKRKSDQKVRTHYDPETGMPSYVAQRGGLDMELS